MDLLIKNGRVIDPGNGVDKVCDVLISETKFAAVGEGISAGTDVKVIDATGKLVVPGLIDIHVHFREPGNEEVETIASGSAAAVAAGFTSVVCMPNTDPAIENETDIEYVHRKGRQTRKTHVYVMGAATKRREGVELADMGFMSEAGAVGFTDDGSGIQDPAVMLKVLKYAKMFGKVVSQHCEDKSYSAEGSMNGGYLATVLGLAGMDNLSEEAMLWRDIQLVKKTGARYHAQHVSTAGSVEIIRQAKSEGLSVTCEVTPHHLLLTEDCCVDYDTNYKVNPPLRKASDVEALRQAVGEGLVDALATDHAPHLKSEKDLEFSAAPFGIASLECVFGLYRRALVDSGILDWSGLISLMTAGPGRVVGIDKGTMSIGMQGDVTIIDAEREYTVDTRLWRSKSKNCPYNGWGLKGVVEKTIVGGEIRFDLEAEG
jgi:dihydroorotase